MDDIPDPSKEPVAPLLLEPSLSEQLAQCLTSDRMSGGWLLVGPPRVGKATLAYALARTILSGSTKLGHSDAATTALVENRGHPDLFVLEREFNEKTGRVRGEITVDAVRTIISGLQRTSTTGRRVVIIDLADHLRREAANALLKSLEEPPDGTVMLLLSAAPGRLLPTIKSRCRRLTLAPQKSERLGHWLTTHFGVSPAEAEQLAVDAGGRPGRALTLLGGDGASARELADMLFAAVRAGPDGDLIGAAQRLASKEADPYWRETRQLIVDRVGRDLRNFPDSAQVPALLKSYDTVRDLLDRADRLNADRQHTVYAVGRELMTAYRGARHVGG